jgi:phosphatidylinositol alpha-mannosyltransferase
MRIAMVSPYSLGSVGGVQGQVTGLARALRAGGHQVTVVAPARDRAEVSENVGDHYVIGSPAGLRSNGSVAPVAPWPTAAARAARFVRRHGFDVVHVHEPLAPMAAYGLALTAPLPMVGTYHRAGVSRWVGPLHPLTQFVGRRLQIRVAVSDAARETGRREGGGEFEVLFNGVEMDRFESAPPERDAQGLPTVLFLGRHEPRKGLPVLLEAFAMVERPAVLWVSGDGPGVEVQRRRQLASDRVRWLGRLNDDQVASRLAGADVLCAPSLHGESFGMVVLEGMAAGCAVVASDIEGYRTAAGGHASLVPPGDARALARAIDDALAEVGSAAATQARKEAVEYARAWSMDTLAQRYLDLYARAIESFRSSHRGRRVGAGGGGGRGR